MSSLDHDQISLLRMSLTASREAICSNFHRLDPPWVRQAIFCYLIVNLRDCLGLLKKIGNEINFTDDLPQGKNITDQIAAIRNAVCHLGSSSRLVDLSTRGSFHYVQCDGVNSMIIGERTIGCPYADDVAIFYGETRILLVRHIMRAFNEALETVRQMIGEEKFKRVFNLQPIHQKFDSQP